jgi:hypothetical protein
MIIHHNTYILHLFIIYSNVLHLLIFLPYFKKRFIILMIYMIMYKFRLFISNTNTKVKIIFVLRPPMGGGGIPGDCTEP